MVRDYTFPAVIYRGVSAAHLLQVVEVLTVGETSRDPCNHLNVIVLVDDIGLGPLNRKR